MTVRGTIMEMEFLEEWLSKQPQPKKFYVPGNHDWGAQHDRNVLRRDVVKSARWLIDEEVTVGGLRMYGSPWTWPVPGAKQWAYPLYITSQAEEKWNDIPEVLDILITHAPPYKIGDAHWVTNSPLGDPILAHRLKMMKKKPKVHIFGHIHSGDKVTDSPPDLDGVLFLNVAICGEGRQYLPENPVTVYDTDKREVYHFDQQTQTLVRFGLEAITAEPASEVQSSSYFG